MARNWGRIHYELDKAMPVEIGLWPGYILTAYQQILDARQWLGLTGVTKISTIPVDVTGTITATLGSTAVTGVGTAWSTSSQRMQIQFADSLETYGITFSSATVGTLDRAFESDTVTGAAFTIYRQNYALTEDVKSVTRVVRPGYTQPLDKIQRDDMLRQPIVFGDSTKWAMGIDIGTDPAYKSIDLWEIPLTAIGLNVEYQRAVEYYDGRNSTALPLPWVSDDAIILGAKALAGMDDPRRDPNRYAAAYQSCLKSMHEAENQRIGAIRFDPTDQFNQANAARQEFYGL